MEFKTKRKSDTVAEAVFNCNSADVASAFEKAYVRAAAKVKIPGFRAGKAPMELVKKQLGDSVTEDAANILVIDSFTGIFEKLDPKPVNRPAFKLKKFDREKGAEFEAEYEYMPEIKLGKVRKLKVDQDQPEFEESLYEPLLNKIREEHVVLLPREDSPAVEGDVVTLSIRIHHGNKELYRNSELDFDTGKPEIFPGLQQAVLNRKAGEEHSYEIDIDRSFPDKRYAGKKVIVNFETKDVRFRELPLLNDELASQASSFETLAALKEDIKKKVLASAEDYLKGKAIDKLIHQIIEKNPFSVPSSLVQSEADRILENLSRRLGVEEGKRMTVEGIARLTGRPEDEVKKEYETMALENIQSRFVIDEVARLEGIEAADADLRQELQRRFAGQDYSSEGLLDSLLEDAALRERLGDEVKVKKTLDWLYSNADIKKGERISCKTLIDEGKIRV